MRSRCEWLGCLPPSAGSTTQQLRAQGPPRPSTPLQDRQGREARGHQVLGPGRPMIPAQLTHLSPLLSSAPPCAPSLTEWPLWLVAALSRVRVGRTAPGLCLLSQFTLGLPPAGSPLHPRRLSPG